MIIKLSAKKGKDKIIFGKVALYFAGDKTDEDSPFLMATIVVYSVATSSHGNPAEQRDEEEEE